MRRIHNLDYLRGLVALGIMIYHYISWTIGEFSVDTFLGRLGVYGVSLFYILSGLTLYHVYYHKMTPTKVDVLLFFKKRIFRIFPLLWFVTIVSIILERRNPDILNVFLNLSGLFGFVKWDTYFSVGVWSIGNELVFYLFFPFFVLFTKRYKPVMIVTTITIFCLYLYFAFFKLNPISTLEDQWNQYVNPLNQVFLFLGGFLIGVFYEKYKPNDFLNVLLLFSALLVFTFYPVSGNSINIVTGFNRIIFTIICFFVCTCICRIRLNLPNFIHVPLSKLGEASYSVYLLHPIIYSIMGFILKYMPQDLFYQQRMTLSIVITLIVSYFVYTYFERYFMKLATVKGITTV